MAADLHLVHVLVHIFNSMLESARSQDARDTPRSARSHGYGSPRDERFFTPRTVARENSASNSDEWGTPRYEPSPRFETPRYGSDGEFVTPRMFDADRKAEGGGGRLNALRRSGSFKDDAGGAGNSSSKMLPPRGRAYSSDLQPQYEYASQAKSVGPGAAYKDVDPYDYDDGQAEPYLQQHSDHSQHQQHQQQESPPPQYIKENNELEDEIDYIALDLAAAGLSEHDVEDVFSYARHGRLEEIERLFNKGLPVDVRDAYGNTVLIIACQNGNKRVAKAVLRRGANINARNHKGNTPLHYCYNYGYGETLGQYIISKGADPEARNNGGKSVWQGI